MTPSPAPYRANPLSAWFLLTTAAAVLVALTLGAAGGSRSPIEWVITLTVLFSLVLGLAGFLKRPRLRNAFLGTLCGAVTGFAAAALMGSGEVGLTSACATMVVGSLILGLVGLAGRTAR